LNSCQRMRCWHVLWKYSLRSSSEQNCLRRLQRCHRSPLCSFGHGEVNGPCLCCLWPAFGRFRLICLFGIGLRRSWARLEGFKVVFGCPRRTLLLIFCSNFGGLSGGLSFDSCDIHLCLIKWLIFVRFGFIFTQEAVSVWLSLYFYLAWVPQISLHS